MISKHLLFHFLLVSGVFLFVPSCSTNNESDSEELAVTYLAVANSQTPRSVDDFSLLTAQQANANLLMNLALSASYSALEASGALDEKIAPPRDLVTTLRALQKAATSEKTERNFDAEISINQTIDGVGTKTVGSNFSDNIEEATGISGIGDCEVSLSLVDPDKKTGTATVSGSFDGTGLTLMDTNLNYLGSAKMELSFELSDYGVFYSDIFSVLSLYKDYQKELDKLATGSLCSSTQEVVSRVNSVQKYATIETGVVDVKLTRDYNSQKLDSLDLNDLNFTLELLTDTPIQIVDGRELDANFTVEYTGDVSGNPGSYSGSLKIVFSGTIAGEELDSTLEIKF